MTFRKTPLLLAALLICMVVPAHADVTIALAGPMTGPQATYGDQMKNGVAMALDDINAAGGVLKQKLQVKLFDDVCDPKQAVVVANKIVAASLPVVIGHFCSGSSIPASSVYAEEGVLMISPGSSNPQLTDAGYKTIFRSIGRDDAEGAVAGDYIADHFKDKKIAIVHDKQTYSKGIADAVAAQLDKRNIKITLRDTVNPGERDYSAFITKLKNQNIEMLFYGGYYNEAGLIVRQMREQGMKTAVMGGNGWATRELWAITGPAGEGMLMSYSPDPSTNPNNAALVKRFKAKNIPADGYTMYAYTALKAWADAVNKIGDAKPTAVAAALRGNIFETPIGKISFDAKGDVSGMKYTIYEWHNGDYKPVN